MTAASRRAARRHESARRDPRARAGASSCPNRIGQAARSGPRAGSSKSTSASAVTALSPAPVHDRRPSGRRQARLRSTVALTAASFRRASRSPGRRPARRGRSGSRPRPRCRTNLAAPAMPSSTRCSLATSSSPVGSSASTSRARRAAAAAIATRCCSPPERDPARWTCALSQPERAQRLVGGWRRIARDRRAAARCRRSPRRSGQARGCPAGARARRHARGSSQAPPRPGG